MCCISMDLSQLASEINKMPFFKFEINFQYFDSNLKNIIKKERPEY